MWLFALVPLYAIYRKNKKKRTKIHEMNYIERIVSIRTTLENNGYSEEANDILNAQMVLGTPGEMFDSVCSKVLGMKKNNKEVYKLIYKDADCLLSYAKEIGHKIRPT